MYFDIIVHLERAKRKKRLLVAKEIETISRKLSHKEMSNRNVFYYRKNMYLEKMFIIFILLDIAKS